MPVDLFRLPLVPLGRHHAPQGAVDVTPNRVRHWVDSHQKITALGYKVPQPWGHQLDAIPADDKMAMRYVKSRWNGGFVNRLEKDDKTGSLVVVGEVPPGYKAERDTAGRQTGRLVNEADHTVVSEMSAGIGNWKCGKTGEVFRDVIVHAAFCTLPVVGGQPGFTSTLSADGSELLTASLANDGVEYLYTLGSKAMDDDKKPSKKTDDGMDMDKGMDMDIPPTSDLGEGDISPIPMEPLAAPLPQPPASNLPMTIPDSQTVNDVVGLMAGAGLTLPATTTPQNFMQNLLVAMTTMVSLGFKFSSPNQGMMGQPEAKIDTSTDGSTPESTGVATAYMSSDPEKPDQITLSSDASLVVNAWANDQRIGYAKAFANLGLPEELARQQMVYLEKAKPSVDPTTKRVSFPEVSDRYKLAKGASGGRQVVLNELTKTAPVVKVNKSAAGQPTVTLSADVDGAMIEGAGQAPAFVLKDYVRSLVEDAGGALRMKE